MPITNMMDYGNNPIEFVIADDIPPYLIGIRFWNRSHKEMAHVCMLSQSNVDCMISKLKEARDRMCTTDQLCDWVIGQVDGGQ